MALSEDEDFVEEEEGEQAEEQAAPKRSRSKKGVAAVRAERHHWLKGGQEQGHSPKRHGGRRAQPASTWRHLSTVTSAPFYRLHLQPVVVTARCTRLDSLPSGNARRGVTPAADSLLTASRTCARAARRLLTCAEKPATASVLFTVAVMCSTIASCNAYSWRHMS